MLRLAFVERFRQRQQRLSRRRQVSTLLAAEPFLSLCPQLLQFPLKLHNEHGQQLAVAELLSNAQQIAIHGESGQGRRLVLAQILHDWLTTQVNDGLHPLPIYLPDLDNPQVAPGNALTSLIYAAEEQLDLQQHGGRRFIALVSGWDDLPANRQLLWRTTLRTIAHQIAGIVVLLPTTEPTWPTFQPYYLQVPSGAERQAFFKHPHSRNSTCLYDEIVISMLTRSAGTRNDGVANLAARYRALRTILPVQQSQQPLRTGLQAWFTDRLADLYQAEQSLASGTYTTLLQLPPVRRDWAIRMAASLLSDPLVLYDQLWPVARQDPNLLLTLARCLRENQHSSPGLCVLVFRRLASMAQSAESSATAARDLLETLEPELDRTLEHLVERRAFRTLRDLLQRLPEPLAAARMHTYALSTQLPDHVAWAMTDELVTRAIQTAALPDQHGQAIARRVYMQVRQGVLPALPDVIAALAELRQLEQPQRIACTRLLLNTPALVLPARLAALSLLEQADQQIACAEASQLASDSNHELRLAALDLLQRTCPAQARLLLQRLISDASLAPAIRHDALQCLQKQRSSASAAVYGCIIDQALPASLRLAAVQALPLQRGGKRRLLQLACMPTLEPLLRALAIQLTPLAGRQRRYPQARQFRRTSSWKAGPVFRRLLADPHTPALVIQAIGRRMGQRGSRQAGAVLLGLLERRGLACEVMCSIISALGQLRYQPALPALAQLVGGEAFQRVRGTLPEALLRVSTQQAIQDPATPAVLRARLLATEAQALFQAERPSTPLEQLLLDADQLRTAAAHALAQIGGQSARTALIQALAIPQSATAASNLIAALDQLAGPDDPSALGQVVLDPQVPARTRWLATQRLTTHPSGERVQLAALGRNDIDSFTQAALAAGLGKRKALGAIPRLLEMSRNEAFDLEVRSHALIGLGAMADPMAAAHLLRLMVDTDQPEQLRSQAAIQLAPVAGPDLRRSMRQLLRTEPAAGIFSCGLIQALGIARDREALPLLLQHSLDDHPATVRAAIEALAQIGDTTVTPALVRISQSPHVDRIIRLEAVGALLQLGGDEFLPLLRSSLQSGSLPLQMQALDCLLRANPGHDQLLSLLNDHSRGIPFRQQVLEALLERQVAPALLLPLLTDQNEAPQLRGRIASSFANHGGVQITGALLQVAKSSDQPGVQLRTIAALAERAEIETLDTLCELALDVQQAQAIRAAAAAAVCQILARQPTFVQQPGPLPGALQPTSQSYHHSTRTDGGIQ